MGENDTTDRGLISKIYKQLIQLNIKHKQPDQKKCAIDLNRHMSPKKTYIWPTGT